MPVPTSWLLEQGPWGLLVLMLASAVAWQQTRIVKIRRECDKERRETAKAHAEQLSRLGQRLDHERLGRLEDAKDYARYLIEMSDRVHRAIQMLTDMKKNR